MSQGGAIEEETTSLLLPQQLQDTEQSSNTTGSNRISTAWNWLRVKFRKNNNKNKKLGMVMGVTIPCILNIFGVIMFLRMGMIVGQAGLWLTLLMFAISYIVNILTVLSISAITTNGKVKGGGPYYLISRSLGPEFGGAIGIIFYFANVFAAAMYIIGTADAVLHVFENLVPDGYWWKLLYGTVSLVFMTFLCMMGASAFSKANVIILAMMMLSLGIMFVSLLFRTSGFVEGFTGPSFKTLMQNLGPSFSKDIATGEKMSFQTLFGVLFSACTGITAGVNMSGDLASPSQAIPWGTIAAVAFTYVVYNLQVFLIAFTVEKPTLLIDYGVLTQVSYLQVVVHIGIFAISISSAMGAIVGSARILQAIGKDKLLPFIKFFRKGAGRANEPRRATLVTYVLVQLLIVVGELNAIAPFATMFFLLSYGALNFACFALFITGAPNFRPLFKYFSWHTALLGAVLSFTVMFFVHAAYAGISIGLQIILIIFIHFYAPSNTWGDISQALIFHQVRKYLLRLDVRRQHVKYWRLQVLHFVANPRSAYPLIDFTNNLKKGGLYIIGHVQQGVFNEQSISKYQRYKQAWLEFISECKIKAFSEITIAPSLRQGIQSLSINAGIGGMKPNTIMLGYYDSQLVPKEAVTSKKSLSLFDPLRNQNYGTLSHDSSPTESTAAEPSSENSYFFSKQEYCNILQDLLLLNKNIMIARHFESMDKAMLKPKGVFAKLLNKKERSVDIWLLESHFTSLHASSEETVKEANATPDPSIGLQLQLGFMINNVDIWRKFHYLRVLSVIADESKVAEERKRIANLLTLARIRAEIQIVCITAEDISPQQQSHSYQTSSVDEVVLEMDNTTIIHSQFVSLDTRSKLLAMNSAIRRNSLHTSTIFMTLPISSSLLATPANYVDSLDVLTNGLPPTLLVHGKSNVLATEL